MNNRWLAVSIPAMLVLLLAGAAGIAYARWTSPIVDGDHAFENGRLEQALASYAVAEQRFDSLPFAKRLFSSEYRRLWARQLLLLYRVGRFDDALEQAERVPESAVSHFWAGCALFAKARGATEQPEARGMWIGRSQDEFRHALELMPDDPNIKFNYELTARLAAEMRKQAKAPPRQMMQLLRPQPKTEAPPPRRIG